MRGSAVTEVCSAQTSGGHHTAGQVAEMRFRRRMGPLKLLGSTATPFCVISMSPAATSSRAAARTGSIRGRQSFLDSFRATSDGQALDVGFRAFRTSRIEPAKSYVSFVRFDASSSPGATASATLRRFEGIPTARCL